jgi:transposase
MSSFGPITPQVEAAKQIGALPAIKRLAERLRLATIVDQVLPRAPQATYGFGEVLVALVMNKLSVPRPLYQLETWATNSGVEPLLGVPPEALTDDRVAALLDAVAENVEPLKAEIFLNAIEHFGLDISAFHWDLTSLEFEGDYDDQHPLFPLITYGYDSRAKGRKKKQYRVADLVVGDGAVGGALHKTYSGNTNDVNTVNDYATLFAQIRDRFGKRPKLIGDTKLVSPEKMADLDDARLYWICPEPHQANLDDQFLQLPEDRWELLPYVTQRELDKPESRRTIYRGQEVEWQYTRPKSSRPKESKNEVGEGHSEAEDEVKVYRFRRIFVFSSEEQKARRESRKSEFERAERHLNEQSTKFRGRYWKKRGEAEARHAVQKILDARKTVGKLYNWSLQPQENGGWKLTYSVDQQALKRLELLDGYYTLVTNVPQDDSTYAVFQDWKKQSEVERRFANWKGPLRVRPLFIKTNKRVVGLIAVLSFALLLFCLLEREVRQKLQESDGRMVGLLPVSRPVRATGRNIIQTLETLTLVAFRIGDDRVWQMVPPNPIQLRLLAMLDVDVKRTLRALHSSRPRPEE